MKNLSQWLTLLFVATTLVIPRDFPQKQRFRISWYNPALGGTNCYPTNWQDNKCVSQLYGKPWEAWLNIGAACTENHALGTKIYLARLNRVVLCVDRGGGIKVLSDGTQFIDLLQNDAPYIRDWKVGIIKDKFCPSGCYVTEGWVVQK